MILFSELSRRRIRSISSLIKVGRQEPSMVLRVDRDKGYIDLTKRLVSEGEALTCEDRYNKSKLMHSIMRHAAETLEVDLEPLYERIGWLLYRKYGHAFEAFKLIVTDPDGVLDVLTNDEKEIGPDGQEVIVSGKLRGQWAKSVKFKDGWWYVESCWDVMLEGPVHTGISWQVAVVKQRGPHDAAAAARSDP